MLEPAAMVPLAGQMESQPWLELARKETAVVERSCTTWTIEEVVPTSAATWREPGLNESGDWALAARQAAAARMKARETDTDTITSTGPVNWGLDSFVYQHLTGAGRGTQQR